jgi:hypothetical protein
MAEHYYAELENAGELSLLAREKKRARIRMMRPSPRLGVSNQTFSRH